MKFKRLQQIESYVRTYGVASFEELCEHFDISLSTVRRDIEELVKNGSVIKTYGGIKINENNIKNETIIKFDYSKDIIGKKAAELVKDGDVVLLGSGSTVAHSVKYLANKKITVITNNLVVLDEAVKYGFKVISVGGNLDLSTMSFVGTQTIKQLSELNATISFIGCNAINKKYVSNVADVEAEIKKMMIKNSKKVALLIDHNKFDETSLYNFADIKDMNYIVTDSKPNKEYLEIFKNNKVKLEVGN